MSKASSIPALPKGHSIIPNQRFCLADADGSEPAESAVVARIVFAGELTLTVPESLSIYPVQSRQLTVLSQDLAVAIVSGGRTARQWTDWQRAHDAFASGDHERSESLWLLLGNWLRFAFLEYLCESELWGRLDLYVRIEGVRPSEAMARCMRQPEYLQIEESYEQCRVSLDLGSRWLNTPVDCYERTGRIVCNGFGLLRFRDLDNNALFSGLRNRRTFQTGFELVSEAGRMLEAGHEEWLAEGLAIRSRYRTMQDESMAALSALINAVEC